MALETSEVAQAQQRPLARQKATGLFLSFTES